LGILALHIFYYATFNLKIGILKPQTANNSLIKTHRRHCAKTLSTAIRDLSLANFRRNACLVSNRLHCTGKDKGKYDAKKQGRRGRNKQNSKFTLVNNNKLDF
jgi:hypothetical protein